MTSERKNSESVPMSKLHDVASENYTKISDEFAKSQQQYIQAISGLQQQYLESANEYTRNLINWMNIQNQLMAKNIELLKEYVKSYNSAIVAMAEYHSNIIKRSNSSVSKVQ